MRVCVFDDLLGDADVFFKFVLGAVDHDGGKAVVHTLLADVKIFAVIQMQRDIQSGIEDGCFHELQKVSGFGVFARACGYLQDQRRLFELCRLHDALNDFHIIDIKCADGVVRRQRLGKHVFGCYECHSFLLKVFILFLLVLFRQRAYLPRTPPAILLPL